MSVRRATHHDLDAMVRLINAAFEVERSFIDGDRTDAEDIRAHMRSGEFLVAVEDDTLLGCVYIEVGGSRGYFGMLAVDPKRQGCGLGRRIVAAAESLCRFRGCTEMEIRIVNLRTELPPYYRALGYAETGATTPFSAETAHLLKKPCHFVFMSKSLT